MRKFIFASTLSAVLMLVLASPSAFAGSKKKPAAHPRLTQQDTWAMLWPDADRSWASLESTAAIAKRPRPIGKRLRKPQLGKASYYSNRFHGRKTASGHPFRQDAYTAAHRTLPLGTWVRVTNTRNQRSVVVQITDRGPYVGPTRIIDLSRRSASELDMLEPGVVPVRVEVVQEYVKPDSGYQTEHANIASL